MADWAFAGMGFYDLRVHGTGIIDIGVAVCGIFRSRLAGDQQDEDEQERPGENFDERLHKFILLLL
jgi:hypothetical protein